MTATLKVISRRVGVGGQTTGIEVRRIQQLLCRAMMLDESGVTGVWSPAATEALRSVQQQTAALEESQSATQSLAAMASDLGATSKANAKADHLASAAEQLSTAVQEISGAATQIQRKIAVVPSKCPALCREQHDKSIG